MGKEALSAAAVESLKKKILPALIKALEGPTLSPQTISLAQEAQELLAIILQSSDSEPPTAHKVAEANEPAEIDAGGELSDEEALMLLGCEDSAAPELGDLSSVEAPPAVASAKEDMSDDEARRLLAEMDGAPVEEPAPAVGAGEDMSDDEARRLLAEMDGAPSAPSVTKATAATGGKPPATKSTSASADDEALALLAAVGGIDDTPAPAPVAAPVHHESAPAAGNGAADIAAIGEIPEFSNNDFSSDPDMMRDFLTNTDELMTTLDETILDLERNPENKETIEAIFRAAHTLKGAAGMFGFQAIERVMHRMENLFDLVRKGKMIPNPDVIDVVFQGLDVLRTLLDAVKAGKPSGTKTAPIVYNLECVAAGKAIQRRGGAGGGSKPAASAPSAASGGGGAEASGGGHGEGGGGDQKAKKDPASSTIRVDLERLDHLVNLVGELVIDRTRFASIEESLRNHRPQLPIASNMSETVQLFGRHMNEIQEIIMKVRMVPIGNAFNKFPRIVRDLARSLGKEIELRIEGETTELDKTLVEQLGDPLVHLIRNSCDHGVEMPDVREQRGKSKVGQIYLGAHQEGNHIVITIEDDGKGIDPAIIRRKGIEKGLIKEEDSLSDRDIFNLIFEPGFSTAEKVTNVSGRGVGMDVVKKQIQKLKGLVDISSTVGKGSTISIRLPLTLAIVQSLLVESRGETFAIPISSIVESRRIEPDDIQKVGEVEIIKLRDSVLPLVHLDETLNLARKPDVSWYAANKSEKRLTTASRRRRERHYVVIVGSAERRFGILVDTLLNQHEMVIKSMGPLMSEIPCVAGGSVLGNGEVVLVLDIPDLESHFRNRNRATGQVVS